MMKKHLSVLFVVFISIIAVAFAALLEVGSALYLSVWFFAGYGFLITLILLPFLFDRPSVLKSSLYALMILSLLILYIIPWNSRKYFLHDFARVQIGMTAPEVDIIMGKYMKGTGWPAIPGTASKNGNLTEVSSGVKMATANTPSGELEIQDSITYRHSSDGAFDSDWGVVKFKNGKVVSKTFLPD